MCKFCLKNYYVFNWYQVISFGFKVHGLSQKPREYFFLEKFITNTFACFES